MTLHKMLDNFFELKLSDLQVKQDNNNRSVWYDAKNNCLIHFSTSDTYTVVRFHQVCNNTNYRITYEEKTDIFRFTVLTINDDVDGLTIEKFSTKKSEDSFFQESLIHNFNDLQFNDIDMFMDLFYTIKNNSLILLGEN